MDHERSENKELCTNVTDREYWRARVRKMKQPRVHVQLGPHIVEKRMVTIYHQHVNFETRHVSTSVGS